MTPHNPFAAESPLPYRLPPFDRIRPEHFEPAFLEGMAGQRAEVAAITRTGAPSLDNTLVALERSGRMLDRVSSVFFNLVQSDGSDPLLALEAHLAPQLAAHRDAIYLDPALFERVEALHARSGSLGLDAESLRLLQRYHVTFLRSGAHLAEADKARLRELNQELSTLRTRFRQNVLRATREGAVCVERLEQLEGLSAAEIGAAAAAARERGMTSGWMLALANTSSQPLLSRLVDRGLRRRLHEASIARARAGAHDNTPIIARLVKLRAERAQLLGYPTHAHYVLADEDAGDPTAVDAMLEPICLAARRKAEVQAARLQRCIDAEALARAGGRFELAAWDWPYYVERLRRERYALDADEVRPYFELERVLTDGAFHVAGRLYGLTFRARTDLPVYHPDVRLYEVFGADGAPLALFLADFYAREGKQGGAWMSQLVTQSRLLSAQPVVLNCLNVVKPPPGEPTLLSFEELTTLFHEFGHALHGMLSAVRYPLLSGTNVPRDFVEYPSQFNEMWARDPEVLARCARHWESGAPLPPALLERIVAAQNFDQGYLSMEYLQAALIDQAWHRLAPGEAPKAEDVPLFESRVLERAGLAFGAIPPRYHSPYFLHSFAEDYSASYYAYLWSEVLARDTGQWFTAHGGLSRAGGERLQADVLSRGWTEDTRSLFRRLVGRAPDLGALLEYRGLANPAD